MKYKVYSVLDKTAGIQGQLMQFVNDEVAKRSMIPILKDMSQPYAQFPSHYDLKCLGTFDDQTGQLNGIEDDDLKFPYTVGNFANIKEQENF